MTYFAAGSTTKLSFTWTENSDGTIESKEVELIVISSDKDGNQVHCTAGKKKKSTAIPKLVLDPNPISSRTQPGTNARA